MPFGLYSSWKLYKGGAMSCVEATNTKYKHKILTKHKPYMVTTFFHTSVHSNLPNLHNLHLFIHDYTLIHTSLHHYILNQVHHVKLPSALRNQPF